MAEFRALLDKYLKYILKNEMVYVAYMIWFITPTGGMEGRAMGQ